MTLLAVSMYIIISITYIKAKVVPSLRSRNKALVLAIKSDIKTDMNFHNFCPLLSVFFLEFIPVSSKRQYFYISRAFFQPLALIWVGRDGGGRVIYHHPPSLLVVPWYFAAFSKILLDTSMPNLVSLT